MILPGVHVTSRYVPNLLKPAGKVVVLVAAAALLGWSIWSAVKLEVNFDEEWFTPDSSYLIDTYAVRDRYWDATEVPGEMHSALDVKVTWMNMYTHLI